jgi:thiamine biosynthesis protein ThiS
MTRCGKIGKACFAHPERVMNATVIANGKRIEVKLPCTLEEFLLHQKLLPRSVVVEQNGEAVAPSEFPRRPVVAGDRLEIVQIVAGG